MDTHEAVKIGDFKKYSEAIKVAGPEFDRHVPRRGGPRSGGRIGFLEDVKMLFHQCGNSRWGPPLVDEAWHRPSARASRERNGRTCTTSSWR